MNIEEYDAPETFADEWATRKDASKIAAAAARKRLERGPAPDAPAVRPQLDPRIVGGIGILAVVGVFALALSQFRASGPLVIPPTAVPAHTFGMPPVTPPAARTEATAIPAQIFPSPVPAAPVEPAPVVAPQTGRGMPPEQPEAVPEVAPTAVPAVSPYIENVGKQAPHVPRGGHCGPTGGDCALGVPPGLDVSAYIANVGKQAPHKVR